MVHSQWVHYVKPNVSDAKAAALHLCFPSYKEATSEVPSIATDPRGALCSTLAVSLLVPCIQKFRMSIEWIFINPTLYLVNIFPSRL